MKRINFVILILIISSCFNNVGRDNPLDPKSEEYQNYGNLVGYVYTYYTPFQPISSAKLSLIPGNQSTFTDRDGAFNFLNITPGNYLVTANCNSYAPDSIQVQIISNKKTTIQFNLDALPQLDTLSLTTGFVHETYPIEPSRLFECKATVVDPDGPADIRTVALNIPHINFKDTLASSQTMGVYQKRYIESDLAINYIEELLGCPVYIEITDRAGKSCQYGPNYLVRIIYDEPEIESPRGSALVSSQPILYWKVILLPFSFTFRVEIYSIIGDQVAYPPIMTFSNIAPDIFKSQIGTPLRSGLYLWTISVVDGFGNWSRSKQATFQVGG